MMSVTASQLPYTALGLFVWDKELLLREAPEGM